MPKAEIRMPDGTHILIEGKSQEIINIVKQIKGSEGDNTIRTKKKTPTKRKGNKSSSGKSSMADLVEELKAEGFFNEPRSLVEIKNAFASKGMIYSVQNISTPILRLVRKRILGRIKEDKKWMYVKK